MAQGLNKEETVFNFSIIKAMKALLFASLFLSAATLPDAVTTDPAPAVAPGSPTFHLTVVRRKEPMHVQVLVAKQQAGEVAISLKNSRGETLYRTFLDRKALTYSLVLDLSELADGTYTLEASERGKVYTKTVNVQTPARERMLALR
jgi:hypothetical protein